MRAIQIASLDGPEAAKLVEIDEPTDEGAVVVEVHAAGVAFPDALQSRGLYQYKAELPFVPGAEIAGVVRSAPSDSGFQAGDRVAGLTMLNGGMAEVVVLQPDRVFKLPDSVSYEAGAGLLFNDLTMHHALRTRGRLADGETVLVHGAAGGIGTSTLRLAPAWGAARTIAVVGTEEKIEIAKAAGASDVVLADGFKDAVKELTDGRGVDIVVDPVGGDRFTDSLRSLAPGGRLLVIGFTGGEIPTVKVNRLLLNNVDAVGVGWGAWAGTHPGYLARAVGRTRTAAGVGQGVGAPAGDLPARARGRGHRVTGEPDRQGQSRRQASVRLFPRRRSVTVETCDPATGQWTAADAATAVDRDELTLTTYNIWNDPKHAEERYLAIAQLLSRRAPDVMVFQEVTPGALDVLLAQQWIRDSYSVRGGGRWRRRATTGCFCCPVCPSRASRTRGCPLANRAGSCRPTSS